MGDTVLIFGAGAREHALAKAYLKSDLVSRVVVAPGNTWMKRDGIQVDRSCSLKDAESMLKVALKYSPDLADVAQDDALASGTVDLLLDNGIPAFGPTKAAARIEWDKSWSRDFMKKYGIPSPKFKSFDDPNIAKSYVKELYSVNPDSYVFVKASGLAAGKGALAAHTLQEALECIDRMKTFGKAGEIFVIEEGLVGEEFSFYAICDGTNYIPLMSAQDHKRLLDHDRGPQTGGMGVVAPTGLTSSLEDKISENFIHPVLEGMKKEGHPYVGILYFSGILVDDQIFSIEYNARWGDPECQAILPGLKTDYYSLVKKALDGNLGEIQVEFDGKTRVCVVGASFGYPQDYSDVKGKLVYGLEALHDVELFSAGLGDMDGRTVANGGRLFSVVGEGDNVLSARKIAYGAISTVAIENNLLHFRTDIGWRDVLRHFKSQ